MSRRHLLRVAQHLPKSWKPIPRGVPRFPHPSCLHLAHVALWFHALSDTSRLHLLDFLSQRDRSVTELRDVTGMPLSTVSFHLKVLTESGLVRRYCEGRWKYYSIEEKTLDYISAFVQKVGPGKHRGTCPLTCCR